MLVVLLGMMPALAALPVHAARPPIRLFTTADGLPSDDVVRIRQDSHGFIWLATSDGVARFDGAEFVIYGRRHGLPVAAMNDILETRDGHIWIATNGGGVARVNPLASQDGSLFTVVRVGPDRASNRVNVLLEGDAGRVWAGTDSGLYRSDRPGEAPFEPVGLHLPDVPDRLVAIFAMTPGAREDLWLATSHGVMQVHAGGGIVRYADPTGLSLPITTILHDGKDLVWMGGASGLLSAREPSDALPQDGTIAWRRSCVRATFASIPLPIEPGSVCPYGMGEGLPAAEMRSLHRTRDGRVLVGAIDGHVWEYTGESFRTRIAPEDSAGLLNSVTSDADGNIWIAGRPGVIRIAQHGLVSFDQRDGLASGLVKALIEDHQGVVYALSRGSLINRMRRFAEDTLSADDIELVFRAEEPRVDVTLGADLRRELFLVLKESVTNIAKHAGCTRVEIDLTRTRRTLRLRVQDNGAGFDLAQRTDGNGLRSMRQRADAMGGRLDVRPSSSGTTVVLDVDLTRGVRLDGADDLAH